MSAQTQNSNMPEPTPNMTSDYWFETLTAQEERDKRERPWAKALEGHIDNSMNETDEKDVLADSAICENISLAA
jgi:hypothetical protein